MTSSEAPALTWESNFRMQMRLLREVKGLTQTDLAKSLKVWGLPFHQQTIQRIETGERPVRLDEAFLIARELGVSLDYMTTVSSPGLRDMKYAVDKLRRETESLHEAVSEALPDWMAAYEGLAYEVLLCVKMEGDTGLGEASWGGAWLQKASWILDHLHETFVSIYGITSEFANEDWRDLPRFDSEIRADVDPLLRNSYDLWNGVVTRLIPESRAYSNPQALYEELGEVGKGDQRVERDPMDD